MGYVGFRLGLSVEFGKLIGLMGGFFGGYHFGQPVGSWVGERSFLGREWGFPLVMAVLLVGGYFLFTRVLRFLEKMVQVTFEQRVNRVGGLLVGLLRGLLTASAILVVCSTLPSAYLTASIGEHSMSGRWVAGVAPRVYEATTPWISRFVFGLRGGGAR